VVERRPAASAHVLLVARPIRAVGKLGVVAVGPGHPPGQIAGLYVDFHAFLLIAFRTILTQRADHSGIK
jgi:hypothetical protein